MSPEEHTRQKKTETEPGTRQRNAKRAIEMKRGKTCALQGHPVRGFKAGTRGMLAAKLGAGGASAADPVAAKLGAGGASAADPVAGAARVGA